VTPAWPASLADDPEPPAVLFVRGDPSTLARPTAALVGTRRCTPTGRAVAEELGRDLAAAGVCVVSGLALGIDGAVHRGALAAAGAAPAAVVGTGLHDTYPRAHAGLAARSPPPGSW
jgi:DNA processing protein